MSAFAIFIASVGQVAQDIKQSLPLGKGHVCLDAADLPMIMKKIIASTLE